MAIITSRTNESGRITIAYDHCNSCGLCVKVYKDFSLIMDEGIPVPNDRPLFGCMACGQCMAVCPNKAIEITGRTMSANDMIDLAELKDKASFAQLKNLMVNRRSVRDFRDKEVEEEVINKIIEAAVTAPMGIPPSDVHLVVFKGKAKVREFSFDVIGYFNKIKWMFSDAGYQREERELPAVRCSFGHVFYGISLFRPGRPAYHGHLCHARCRKPWTGLLHDRQYPSHDTIWRQRPETQMAPAQKSTLRHRSGLWLSQIQIQIRHQKKLC